MVRAKYCTDLFVDLRRGQLQTLLASVNHDLEEHRKAHANSRECLHDDPFHRRSHLADVDLAAVEEFHRCIHTLERDVAKKNRIEAALRRIERGEYDGCCLGCGDEIGEARLVAEPTATLCCSCKGLEEHRERQSVPQRPAARH